MKKSTSIHILICIIILFSCKQEKINTEFSIIPTPTKLEIKEGVFEINSNTKILNPSFQNFDYVLDFVNTKLKKSNDFQINTTNKESEADIIIKKSNNEEIGNEGYKLIITSSKINIEANTSKAVFYAFQTLFSMLPEEIEKSNSKPSLKLQAISIVDIPQFKYRGMHLDVCRHYMPLSFIKKFIDYIARYKMNTFHWHLSEDQGWRIEIKKYPKLTAVGAWRDKTIIGHASRSKKYDDKKFSISLLVFL